MNKIPPKLKEEMAADGWQVIIPESDILPHGLPKEGEKETSLAWLDCPCKPKVNVGDKIIIHNSFTEKKFLNEVLIHENPDEMNLV